MISTLENISGWNTRNILAGNEQLKIIAEGKQTLIKLEQIEKERLYGLRDLLIRQGAQEGEIMAALNIFRHNSMLDEISETREEINLFFERRNQTPEGRF
jgi:hypothetical protein